MDNIRVMLSAASMFGGAGLSPKRNAFLQFEEFEDCGQYEWLWADDEHCSTLQQLLFISGGKLFIIWTARWIN